MCERGSFFHLEFNKLCEFYLWNKKEKSTSRCRLHFFTKCNNCSLCYLVRLVFCIGHSFLCRCSWYWCIAKRLVRMIWDVILLTAATATDRSHTLMFGAQLSDSITLAVKVLNNYENKKEWFGQKFCGSIQINWIISP